MAKRKRDPQQPTKYRFNNLHVINSFLTPKIEGQAVDGEGEKIFEQNIYATAPQSLDWNPIPELYDNERYYFVKRIPVSSGVQHPKKTRRTLDSGNGYWKKSNRKDIKDGRGERIGWDCLLNFWEYTDSDRTREKSIRTRFLMHEYSLDNAELQEWVVCKVEYKVGRNAVLQQQQPMIPLAPLPQLADQPLQPQPYEDQHEHDQFSDDERTMISEDLIESVLGEECECITATTTMNINEYEEYVEGQQQEASVVSHYYEDYESIASTSTTTNVDDRYEEYGDQSQQQEASVVSQLDDQIMGPFPTLQANQCGEAYDFNSGLLISQYQPQLEDYESIATTTMSIEEHQQQEEASVDYGFRSSSSAQIPMPQHLVFEESQTSLHDDWLNSYLEFCQSEDPSMVPEFLY